MLYENLLSSPSSNLAQRHQTASRQAPPFITDTMWLVWLIRADVRAGAAIHDPSAQRDYVAWWLLFGRWEYPAVWWYGPAQVAIVMDPSHTSAVPLPRLLLRLHASRPDLQASFNLDDREAAIRFLCWYRLFGAAELAAAPPLSQKMLHLTETARPGGLSPMAVTLWQTQPELQLIMDLKQASHRAGLSQWYAIQGAKMIPQPLPLPDWAEIRPSMPCRARPTLTAFHLVGFALAEFGIGEDVRAMSRSLEAAEIAHSIESITVNAAVSANDTSRIGWLAPAMPGSATVFCLTAFDTVSLFLERGLAPFEGAWNIGYWPWELDRFPDEWKCVYGLVDEVWAATSFQAAAYAVNSTVPVRLMPPAITVPKAVMYSGTPALARRARGRPFHFIYPFDPKSTLARKNPIAAVRAFRTAFPTRNQSVDLLLRANGPITKEKGWSALRAAMAGDRRIRLTTDTLPRVSALQMIGLSDCLVSPHRAEGLGRNIGEAIALGVPVLATGPSGSADFLLRLERIPAHYRRLKSQEYPFGDGLGWFEPDQSSFARQMRRLWWNRSKQSRVVLRRRAELLLACYGVGSAGKRYAMWLG